MFATIDENTYENNVCRQLSVRRYNRCILPVSMIIHFNCLPVFLYYGPCCLI